MAATLEAMAGAPDGASTAPADLIAQLERDDPRMGALCRLVLQRQADAAGAVPAPSDDGALDALRDEHARLRRIASAMRRELARLRDVSAMAAAALGACDACWGRDAGCPHCAGHGRPGAEMPDVALYARLVAPAVRRLAQDGRPRPRPPTTPDRAAGDAFAGPLD